MFVIVFEIDSGYVFQYNTPSKLQYAGCSKSSWPEHQGEEIQGSFYVWEYYKSK